MNLQATRERATPKRRCPACHEDLLAEQRSIACSQGHAAIHEACAELTSRCPALGCAAPLPQNAELRARERLRLGATLRELAAERRRRVRWAIAFNLLFPILPAVVFLGARSLAAVLGPPGWLVSVALLGLGLWATRQASWAPWAPSALERRWRAFAGGPEAAAAAARESWRASIPLLGRHPGGPPPTRAELAAWRERHEAAWEADP